MRRDHEAYEALAGAILLGEATAEERAAYAAHAAVCALCEDDIDTTHSLVSTSFVSAQQGETWRPFVRDEVNARIERGRSRATRRVTTLLGGAVAATLAFNVALAVGFGSGARHLALPSSSATVAAHSVELAAPVSTLAGRAAAPALRKPIASASSAQGAPHRRAAPSHSATRERSSESVLSFDRALPVSSPSDAEAFPATLVTLPLTATSDARARR